ncbi:MAG TPA: preprotein translocase subunit SecE [Candidatus Saccharimonadales bacterium]
MADDQTKRRVKNPETFRERAVKAASDSGKPTKRGAFKAQAGRLIKPVGQVRRTIFDRQPFKFIAKIIFPSYFRNSWRELRLVTWPSWRESRRLTFAVLIFAIIFGSVIALVDYGLDKIFKDILLK